MRTVKDDVKLLKNIKDALFSEFNPDGASTIEMDHFNQLVITVFENQNKWLLSDKISSEKQARMDSYASGKASLGKMGNSPGGEENQPTEKQLAFAKKLGVDIPAKINRSDLSVLIDIAKKSKAEKIGDFQS